MTEIPTPGMKTINGHTYVKVQDLADAWHTTTSHILRTGKPNQVPAQYRKTVDGCTWCDVDGLRYRLDTMKTGSNLAVQLKQLVGRFPKDEKHVDDGLGPQVETIHTKDGHTCTISRCFIQRIDFPSQEEIQVALANRQVLWRYKNKRIQVLAQTLSNFLGTRTSSLLAVDKKHGVSEKFIHREWKRTWVDLDGLKKRVEQTGHSSELLKVLKQVIEILDAYKAAYTRPPIVGEPEESASAPQPEQTPKSVKSCDLAVEANKRAVHNTERINKLTRDETALENLIFKYRDAVSVDLGTQSKRLDRIFNDLRNLGLHVFGRDYNQMPDNVLGLFNRLTDRVKTLESREHQCMSNFNSYSEALHQLETRLDNEPVQKARFNKLDHQVQDVDARAEALEHDVPQLLRSVSRLENRVGIIEAGDKQAVQAMTEKRTPFDALSQRVGGLATHTDRLDTKTDGLVSRVSVLEDTSKWLSWSLATVLGVRLLGLTLHWLRRK